MSASLLLNLVHPDMKMSEKFDFVENYLQRIAGGEFFRFGMDCSKKRDHFTITKKY
jgi:hypothetical protein